MKTSKLAEGNTAYTLAPANADLPVIDGKAVEIGQGFTACAFREKDFSGAMDPLVLVDHYRMTKPTFGAHPHAGLSAVSLLFEDSQGDFHNRDSLGNDFDLRSGDLYWLKAGAGVIHDESPRQGASIHGLQVFVNLPAANKHDAPTSLHVKSNHMPVYQENGVRVRVALGESNGLQGNQSPALPMTILDGVIDSGADFSHQVQNEENTWLYVVKGELKVVFSGQEITLYEGQAIAIPASEVDNNMTIGLSNSGNQSAHFALFAAKPVSEDFVQKGPFVMSTDAEIARVEADFAAGKLGTLD